jgi:branched-chain amino acid transport system ATP-binding protein
MNGPLLEVQGLSAGYGRKQVLFGVSMIVQPQEVVAIIGPNGAGKSTLVKTVMGYLRSWEGEVRFRGRPLLSQPPWQRARLGIAYVPQGRVVFPHLSVEENLALGGWGLGKRAAQREALQRVYDSFPLLKQRRLQKAGTLSGGERQLLSVARSLMISPSLLILDEPTLGLAPAAARNVLELLRGLAGQGIAVVMVEQNARAALARADRGYVLVNGTNLVSGPAADLLADPKLDSVVLGVYGGAQSEEQPALE